jgi:hypothetical protein
MKVFSLRRTHGGDWIKVRADLHTHPKVVRILSALNAVKHPQPVRTVSDTLRVVGALHAVWCVFDTHSIDARSATAHLSLSGAR